MNDRIVEGRPTRRTRNAYGVRPDVEDRSTSLHIPDFLAFVTFGFPSLVAPQLGLPLNETGPALLVVLAVFRTPWPQRRVPTWFVVALVAILVELTAVSLVNDLTPARRLLHVALYGALAYVIASGRVHLLSAARGIAVGLSLSVLASVVQLARDPLQGRLVGTLGDPNAGGFLLVVLGAVALGVLPRTRWRLVFMVLVGAGVVLTFSRTSLLAASFAGVWVLVGRRLNLWGGGALIVGVVYLVAHIPPELRLFGPFSDRTGSDSLRSRIVSQEKLDVATSPLFGSGAGTASVRVGDDQFFYHSSYLAAQREGGLLLLALLVGLGALTLLTVARSPYGTRNPWLEASIISLAVVAVNLGEVLLELPAAVAMGAAVYHACTAGGPDPPPSGPRASSRPALRPGIVR